MANLYTPELTADASADDIVGEITFIEILKQSTIESPTQHSEAEIAHLDSLLADLQQRFETAGRSVQQPSIPSNWDGVGIHEWNGSGNGGYHNGGADLGGESLTPASVEYGAASSSHTPLESPSISLKRSRTLSTQHHGASCSASKRQSPANTSPHSPICLGDDDLLNIQPQGGLGKPVKSESGSLGHLGAHRKVSDISWPSQVSRPRGGRQVHPVKTEDGPSFGRASQLPTRPHLLQHTSQFGSSSSVRVPSLKVEAGTSDSPFSLDSPDELLQDPPFQFEGSSSNGFQHQNPNSIRFGQSSALGRSAFSGVGQDEAIDLTGDSPTDGTQDDPIMVWSNSHENGFGNTTSPRHTVLNTILSASNGTASFGSMPGTFPNDNFIDLDAAYTENQNGGDPTLGQYNPAPPYSNMENRFSNTDLQIGGFETTSWMTDDDFANLLGVAKNGAPDPFTSTMAYPRIMPGGVPPQESLLTRLGLGNLEDDLTLREPEELKKLLENIRPDEDLPPELREQTPVEMDVTLMEHQKLGLTWLKKMEQGSNNGGILADDMGLGKTIQALSLILARPSEDPLRKTTLIIAPVALMRQWEVEIKDKVHTRYELKVHVYHGASKKTSWARLRQNDVVLTTFGTLGQEFKKKRDLLTRMAGQQDANLAALSQLPLVGENSKWYRVIIDEAQCIKNKSTLNAQAAMELQSIYRLCMTGTPMMNSVEELYSLIKFLRIGPYDEWPQFNQHFARPIKGKSQYLRDNAMKRLQALLKAILLRRTKSSQIDGKPIITIPPKHVRQVDVTFSDEELSLYKALETKSQITFNKYLRAGSVTNNYANILVLLLRLRQACCHPHLIGDLSVNTSVKDIPDGVLSDLASQLSKEVVERLKGYEGFECPVCYDAVENPTIFIPCGHNTCSECFSKLLDPQRAIQAGNGDDGAQSRCPECRNEIRSSKVTDFVHFLKVHMPEELPDSDSPDIKDNPEDDEDSDSDSDSEEEDDDGDDTLGGFIVNDEDEGVTDGDRSESEETEVQKPKGKDTKSKGKGKGKQVKRDKPKKIKMTLAQLKKESMRNIQAKTKYLRRLKKSFVDSAKILKTVEILQQIEENDSEEKTIIFSQFASLLDLLEVPLSEKGVKYERYDGSMKTSERVDAVNEFMNSATCTLMLISLKAGNAGLNLNKASQVIILDPFWNPYIEDQAVDRAHRMMQKRDVHVHRLLVPGTVEDRILALQERKRQMISEALDENAGRGIARLGVRELGYLFGVNQL